MNLQELRTFLTIVETCSLVRASEALNVTQSTVTARLKSLEDEIGQTLINRSKSGASMTAAGTRLHGYAGASSDLWRQARQETALPDGMSAVCNLACEFDLWPNLGAQFFQSLRDEHPEIAMSVWLGSAADVATWLDEGKSDLAFTYRAAVSQKQEQIALTPDQLVLVSTKPDSPMRFDPAYIFVEAGQAFARDHAAAYADAGTARISFGNAVTGLEHLLQSGGSAYLPLRMVAEALSDQRLYLLDAAPTFRRSVYLNYNSAARSGSQWLDGVLGRMSQDRKNSVKPIRSPR